MSRAPTRLLLLGVTAAVASGCAAPADPVPADPGPVDTSAFVPSSDDPDPSSRIPGVVVTKHVSTHVTAPERVDYRQSPPDGGAHDQVWADCTGVVYPDGLRTEHAVHSLEHGAVWLTWDPATADADTVRAITDRVAGQPYLLASPYPGQPTTVSVQSWGRQLRLESATDPRIDQFVTALRQNPSTTPEPGASCTAPPGLFDRDDPPPFDGSPVGPGAARQN